MLEASVPDSGCHNQQSDGWRLPFPLDLAIWPFSGRAIALVAAPFALAPTLFQPFAGARALKQAFVGYPARDIWRGEGARSTVLSLAKRGVRSIFVRPSAWLMRPVFERNNARVNICCAHGRGHTLHSASRSQLGCVASDRRHSSPVASTVAHLTLGCIASG
jgi:hypothetical protein